MTERQITIRVPTSVADAIDYAAMKNKRSLNSEINAWLEFYIKEKARKRKKKGNDGLQ